MMENKSDRSDSNDTESGDDVALYTGPMKDMPLSMSRRGFLAFGTTAALALALPFGTLTGCKSEAGEAIFHGERKVVDHAGREVTIPTPDALERVYFTSGLAEIFVFSLMPDVIAGTAIRFSPVELEYLPEGFEDLSYMGGLSGGAELDRETLLAKKVQLIFSISGIELTASNISEAEDLQKQTGIPVLLVDGSFDKIATAYRFLGDIFGVEDRAEELALYLEDIYARVTDAVKDVPQDDRLSLYYAEGPVGLQTEPDVSQHALTFEIASAINVAAVEQNQGLGMSNVSLEQVIAWDPEVIVAWSGSLRGGADEIIRTQREWSTIKAVKNDRVYTMPNIPFAWCDRPPGVNRFMGIQWVANMLYPDLYDVDMVDATIEFYSKLYWCDISTDQALFILGSSYPPKGRQAKYTFSDDYDPSSDSSGTSDKQSLIDRSNGAD